MANNQNSNSENREIPVKVVSEFSVGDDERRQRRIAAKAYELYHCRGGCHARDLDDWLEAERIISSEESTAKSSNAQDPQPRGTRAKKP